MCLDRMARPLYRNTLDDIRIKCALSQKRRPLESPALFFENLDKGLADELPFFLRVRHFFEPLQEERARVNNAEIHPDSFQEGLDFTRLPLAQKTIVDEDRMKSLAKHLAQKNREQGRI